MSNQEGKLIYSPFLFSQEFNYLYNTREHGALSIISSHPPTNMAYYIDNESGIFCAKLQTWIARAGP